MAEPENAGLLRALGQVEPPVPGVLEAAREVLWSAVAGEMLSGGEASEAGKNKAGGTGRSQPDIWRRRTEPGS
ncbi:MAG: hypothetical protein ACREOE_11865 [Gemmatimonadales bacterium]